MLTDYSRDVLPNGLRVVGVERPELHSFVCAVLVHAGPRFETTRQTGLTHFLEHMLMQGSSNFPTSNEIMRAVEDLGGVLDASTALEYMEVSVAVHRKHWRRGMEVLSDVVLRPLLAEDEIEQEKNIVAQEIAEHRDRSGRNISPEELAYSLLFKEQLDEAGSRGSVELLSEFDPEMVSSQYQRFFAPNNMVICLAGSFDGDEVCEEIREQFGQREPADDLPEPVQSEVKNHRTRCVYRQTENLPVIQSVLSHRGYALRDSRFDATRALCEILGGGLSSRLFSRVRDEYGLVYQIQSYLQGFSDAGAVNTMLHVEPDNLLDAMSATLDVIDRMTDEGVQEQELERYKETVRCGIEIMCDRPERLAEWFGKQELLLESEDIKTPDEHIERQESLTLDHLYEVGTELFDPDSANLAVVGPFGEEHRARLRERFPAEEAEGLSD